MDETIANDSVPNKEEEVEVPQDGNVVNDGNHDNGPDATATVTSTESLVEASPSHIIMDETEQSLGISTYMSPTIPGFSAVLKARYSDFVVHEINRQGKVARLTTQTLRLEDDKDKSAAPAAPGTPATSNLETVQSNKEGENKTLPPQEDVAVDQKTTTTTETPNETMADEATQKDATTPPGTKTETEMDVSASSSSQVVGKRKRNDNDSNNGLDWKALESQLSEKIKDDTIAAKVMAMLQSHIAEDNSESGNNKNDNEEKFVTLPKLADKQARKDIHEWVRSSVPCARADTVDGGAIRIWHIKYQKEMPNFKSFGNTHKVRKESHKKKRKQGWPVDRPDFLQCVLYKENMDTTTATKELSRKGTHARIGYAGMKDKRGITTQFVTLYRTEPEQILQMSQQQGGGNTRNKGYSVVQVGNFEYVTEELRLGMLQGNRFDVVLRNVSLLGGGTKKDLQDAARALQSKGFINYFGTQRFGKFHDTHLVGIAMLQGNYRRAVDIILQPKEDERTDISQARKEWQNRFVVDNNNDGSASGGDNGSSPNDKKKSPEAIEAACAKRVMRNLNRFMTAENAILQSLSRKPCDYQRALTCIPKTLRLMFLHAVQSLIWNQLASSRLDSMSRDGVLVGDLVIPPPLDKEKENSSAGDKGEIVNDDKSTSKRLTISTMVHVVTEDDVATNRFSLDDVVLPLVGSKSQYPKNESGDLIDKLLQKHGITKAMLSNIADRELSLVGDYRKMICRPTDVDFEIVEYFDPLQPLLQTDLMKLKGQEIKIIKEENDIDDEKKPLLAVVVGFTLPSSSYATIALRELMKTPTSSEYQKDLKLEA